MQMGLFWLTKLTTIHLNFMEFVWGPHLPLYLVLGIDSYEFETFFTQ